MVPNRIMRGGAVRGAPVLLAAALALALALGSCGGGSSPSEEDEKSADAAILNEVLGRQMSAVVADDAALRGLRGPDLAAARRFRAQEQEHIDAVVKELRGLGAESEPRPETIEPEAMKTPADHLRFLYEVENGTIDRELTAISELAEPWPRGLLTTTVANQAQHLVLLRRALGVKPLETIPEPFEDGTTPAP
jgi:hypothetical protein